METKQNARQSKTRWQTQSKWWTHNQKTWNYGTHMHGLATKNQVARNITTKTNEGRPAHYGGVGRTDTGVGTPAPMPIHTTASYLLEFHLGSLREWAIC